MIWVVHPGFGSRIRILTFHPSRIQDPGFRIQGKKGTVSGSATLLKYSEMTYDGSVSDQLTRMPEMTEALSTKPEEKEQEEAAGSGTDSEGDDSDIPELEETAGETQ
jgi:hypothetical protein